jgi:hypothetical protein
MSVTELQKHLNQSGWAAPAGSPLAHRRPPLEGRRQELKFKLHRKLLDKINLDALASIETQTLRVEVRDALDRS